MNYYVKACGCKTDDKGVWVLCDWHSHFSVRLFMLINDLFDNTIGRLRARIWVFFAKRKVARGMAIVRNVK